MATMNSLLGGFLGQNLQSQYQQQLQAYQQQLQQQLQGEQSMTFQEWWEQQQQAAPVESSSSSTYDYNEWVTTTQSTYQDQTGWYYPASTQITVSPSSIPTPWIAAPVESPKPEVVPPPEKRGRRMMKLRRKS